MALAELPAAVARATTTLPYVEAHVVDHCNLNCRGCGHFSPVAPPRFLEPASFARDIARVAELFDRVERVHLLGGEPLLHPRMLEFTAAAREALPDSAVGLITNGLLLPRMAPAWWDELARQRVEVRVSAYPIGLRLDRIRPIAEQHGVELVVTDAKQHFFTIPLRTADDSGAERSFEGCRELFDCPFLDEGKLYPCPVIPLSRILTERFGVRFARDPDDHLDIHDPGLTAEQVLGFLGRPAPWCGHCDMAALRWTPWGHSRRALTEWT